MNAYKCDICQRFFEDKKHDVRHTALSDKIYGHHTLELLIKRANKPDVAMFTGDICPDCYGSLCEQMVTRGCKDEHVALDAEDHRTETGEALTTDAAIMEYFRMYYTGKPIGYFDDLIDYLSQYDESDGVKVKYIRQKIEKAVGKDIDWYAARRH